MTVSVDIHSANDLAIWLDVYKDNLETSRDLDQPIRSFDFERDHICSDLRKRVVSASFRFIVIDGFLFQNRRNLAIFQKQ